MMKVSIKIIVTVIINLQCESINVEYICYILAPTKTMCFETNENDDYQNS